MKASMQKWLCEALSLHCMFRVMLKPSLRRDNVSKRASDSRVILYPPPVEGHRNNGNGTALTKDAHKLTTKRQSLRWVHIGRVSMISAQLVGVVDILIGKVTWKRDSWKRRADGTERPVGGLGVLFFGDFSQLKPVSGTTLASHPEVAVRSIATHGNNGVWESSGRRWRNKILAWRLPGIAQSPKPVSRRPPVCVESTN